MRRLSRILAALMILVVMLVALVFVLENQQSVSLSFLGFSSGQMPISVFVVVALIVGMLIGPLLGFLVRTRRYKALD
ncbi:MULTISPECIES: lipopolysaccharide assembly protein LapA domain-containing protein [Pseudomonas]|uniref:LapA family protein n=1 Tax=Pseudomonas azadiae TaxID=2843612 RepID=A0ABS6P220_9PSED|nr:MULTISPECIES: LapA family protein [Pseudomonas]MBV4454513.1 LapA family protein [Pseudomonas azadiae]NMF39687.1 LapA family protein [Pseudomonas sp. SWRI 103]